MEKNNFKATAFKSSREQFDKMISDSKIKYCKRVKRDKDIYIEFIIAFVDIHEALNAMLNIDNFDANRLYIMLNELSTQSCRVIYNTSENIMFIVTSELALWSDFLKINEIEKMELINDNTLKRLSHNQISGLIEVELDTIVNDELQSYILSGESLENNTKFKEYFKNIISVKRYVRIIDGGTLEISCDNIIQGIGIKKIDIARILSKSVVKD